MGRDHVCSEQCFWATSSYCSKGTSRAMGFNIYDDAPAPTPLVHNEDPKSPEAVAEIIFNQHAQGDVMTVPE